MRTDVTTQLNPADVLATLKKVSVEPLRILPEEWRPVVYLFCLRWNHLVQGHHVTLCVRVNEYREAGIEVEEMRNIFAAVNTSEEAKPVAFPADLLGLVAAKAGAVLKTKRTISRNAADREADRQAAGSAARSFLAGIGDGGGGFHNT